MGKNDKKNARPIVVSVSNPEVKNAILKKTGSLKGTNVFVKPFLSKEIMENMKRLQPVFNLYKEQGDRPRFNKDELETREGNFLWLDGRTHRYDDDGSPRDVSEILQKRARLVGIYKAGLQNKENPRFDLDTLMVGEKCYKWQNGKVWERRGAEAEWGESAVSSE